MSLSPLEEELLYVVRKAKNYIIDYRVLRLEMENAIQHAEEKERE